MGVKLGLTAFVHKLDQAAKGDLQMALIVGSLQERASCSGMQTLHLCGLSCCCMA